MNDEKEIKHVERLICIYGVKTVLGFAVDADACGHFDLAKTIRFVVDTHIAETN